MGFDPDAYLAAREGAPTAAATPGGFDPDAYLAQKQKQAALLAGIEKQKAKVAALNAEPDPMSFGEIAGAIGSEMGNRLVGMGKGALTLGSAALHPIDTLTTPEKRRELERGVDDIVTLGYGQKLAARIGNALGDVGRGQSLDETKHFSSQPLAGDTAEPSTVQRLDAEAAPGYRQGGNLAGMFIPGAGNAIGKGAGALAGKAIGAGTSTIGNAARAALRGAAGYDLAAPATAALQASSEGHRLAAAKDAALDPAGQLMASGSSALGNVVAGKINKSRGAEARRFIEAEGNGARVGVGTPGAGGVYDNELAGLAPTDKSTGIAAKRAATNIDKSLKGTFRAEVKAPYGAVAEQIDASPEGSRLRDITPLTQSMKDAVYDLNTSDFARDKLSKTLALINERYAPEEEGAPIMIPESQLNGLRRNLMALAKVGDSDSPKAREMPLRQAAFQAKQMVDEGPYASLNKVYAEGAKAFGRTREQLGLDRQLPRRNAADIKKIKLSLEREPQNTRTAGGDSDLEAFRAEHPDLRLQTNLPKLAEARANLAFRLLPQHGGLIDRTVGATLGPAAALGAAAAHGGAPGVLSAVGIMGLQNATPIAGRMLYPLANRGTVNPLIWADQEKRRKDAELAARLFSGGGSGP